MNLNVVNEIMEMLEGVLSNEVKHTVEKENDISRLPKQNDVVEEMAEETLGGDARC